MIAERVLLLTLLAIPALAGEYALLDSGTRMRVDGHEPAGENIRLHLNGGYVEVPAASVVAFEKEEYVPAPASKPAPAAAAAPDPNRVIDSAADKYGIPPAFLHSLVKAESGYQPNAVSPKGAIGLMQLMPSTARQLNADPHDVLQNVDAGTQYLADLLRRYGGHPELALAAYNAGPGAVDRYKGIPPYRETQSYINRVIQNWMSQKPARPSR